jgi:tetratricopeptide (TPR) repeat protein
MYAQLAGILVLLTITIAVYWPVFLRGYEEMSLLVYPSAALAYSYGVRHFDARNTDVYDFNQSERMFHMALVFNPDMPLLRHELARVEFLKGNFRMALWFINGEFKVNPSPAPSSYYMRGLILGYMGRYSEAASDYEQYLAYDSSNWAAINDYAWVLLKADKFADAERTLRDGLSYFPGNPWLLNSRSVALFGMGRVSEARDDARKALIEVSHVTESQWLTAYPGNDPRTAGEGVDAFVGAVRANMHRMAQTASTSAVQ